MQVDAEGMIHIMNILSNLYSNASLAVLREYSCNAWDSHVMAGITDPIEVFLPNSWDSNLIIKDHGVGLSKEELVTIYSTYGKSTKGHSNELIGALGIGSKSAFTITSQFVVEGIKDGRKTVALCSVNERGNPTISILSETDTTEPNGVSVTIAVNDYRNIVDVANTFFSYWPAGRVLVDGKAPVSALDNMLEATQGMWFQKIENAEWRDPKRFDVVMGGVRYDGVALLDKVDHYNSRLNRLINERKLHLIVEVPIGSVDITPSREELRDTPKTIDALKQALNGAITLIVSKVLHDSENLPTVKDTVLELRKWEFALSGQQGSTFRHKDTVYYADLSIAPVKIASKTINRQVSASIHDDNLLSVNAFTTKLDEVVLVTNVKNWDKKELLRRSASRYFRSGARKKQVIYIEGDANSIKQGWFDSSFFSRVMSQTEFNSLNPVESSNGTVTYIVKNLLTGTSTNETVESIKRKYKNPLVCHYNNRYQYQNDFLVAPYIDADTVVLIVSGRQTVEACLTRIPGSKLINTKLHEIAQTIWDETSQEDKDAILIGSFQNNFMDNLSKTFKDCEDLFGSQLTLYNRARGLKQDTTKRKKLEKVRQQLGLEASNGWQEYSESIMKKYPLLGVLDQATWIFTPTETLKKHARQYVESVLQSDDNTNTGGSNDR